MQKEEFLTIKINVGFTGEQVTTETLLKQKYVSEHDTKTPHRGTFVQKRSFGASVRTLRKVRFTKTPPESSVQFSSVQSLDRLGRRGNVTGDSAEILFQCFLHCEQFWHG